MSKNMQIVRQCKFCNKYFRVSPSVVKKGSGKYCSRECKDLKHSDLMKGKKHSIQTRIKQSVTKIGKNNSAWIDGRSFIPYPLGWNNTFKEQIRYRDQYKCQECGMPEVEYIRKLDIHHKDCNKNNLSPENLITLCRKCHIAIHNKLRNKIEGTIELMREA